MISIVNQVKEDMKKGKFLAKNFVSNSLSSKHGNKSYPKDNKEKPNHEKKKTNMKWQYHKPKKPLFKENFKFYKKYGHKRTDCFKLKKWLEKRKKGRKVTFQLQSILN